MDALDFSPTVNSFSAAKLEALFTDVPHAPSALLERLEHQPVEQPADDGEFAPRGARHSKFVSLAASLRGKGVPMQMIRSAMHHLNSENTAPLPNTEIEHIADWFEGKKSVNDFPSPLALPFSEYLASALVDEVRWVKSGIFRTYQDDRWKDDPSGDEVRARITEIVRRIIGELQVFQDTEHDEESKKAIKNRIRGFQNLSVRAFCDFIKAERAILSEAADWDSPALLAVKNGVLDLNTLNCEPSSPQFLTSKQAHVTFDPLAQAPRFRRFLSEIQSPDRVDFILQVFAHALLAVPTDQLFFVLVGTGANGKSVLVELFKWLFGDYAVGLPAHTLTERSKSGPSEELSALSGARLAIFPELPNGAPFNASLIKTLTGGDTIFTRRLYGHGFEFICRATPIMTSNFMPVFDGGDGGMKRRVCIVPFEATIPEEKRNPNLLAELKEEGPGILNALLDSLRRLRSGGFVVPQTVREFTARFVEMSDLLSRFCGERLRFEATGKIPCDELYLQYKIWAGCNGYKPLSRNTFESSFGARFPEIEKKRVTRGMVWTGVAMM